MIPLYKPFVPSLPEMDEILHSGQLAAGKYTKAFETGLQNYFGHNRVLTSSTFNTAISIAITTMGLQYGDEVIASPMACLASTQPYATAGLKIVWADIDPLTGTLSPDSVKDKISSRTKAIVHNHFCGYVGYIDEINDIGRQNGITVIDDGIECFGSLYKERLIGDCGTDVTVFSFNPVRVLTTVDGGAVLFRDANLVDKAVLVRDCGIDRTFFRDEIGEISPNCDIILQGYSATLSNVNSYIGIKQLETFSERINKQRLIAKKWEENLHRYGNYRPLSTENGLPNYWVYGILAKNKRDCILGFREKGFFASGVHINNNIYSVFGKEKTMPGVKEFYDSFVALPCGWWVDSELI